MEKGIPVSEIIDLFKNMEETLKDNFFKQPAIKIQKAMLLSL